MLMCINLDFLWVLCVALLLEKACILADACVPRVVMLL